MKSIKKLILFILLFLFIICLKSTVFGVTITEVEYNGVVYKPDVEPLTLRTKTNSYIIVINKTFDKIVVAEPYNSNDFLVSYIATFEHIETYNRICGYNISTSSLTDLYYYTCVYSDGSWSSWEEYTTPQLSAVASR